MLLATIAMIQAEQPTKPVTPLTIIRRRMILTCVSQLVFGQTRVDLLNHSN